MSEPAPPAAPRLPSAHPSHAYYRACEGRWSGPLDFVVTDWRALGATPLALADRLTVLSLAWGTRFLGALRIETSVDYASGAARGVVVHTTRISKWGLTLLRGIETLRLDANGRDLTMDAETRMVSTPWRTTRFTGAPASVDEAGMRATYRFPYVGTEMRQRGERSADGTTVTLTQETAFSRGVQVLRRS